MKEVEVLVRLNQNKEEVLEKLKNLNFVGEKKISDTYFYDPLRDSLKLSGDGKLRECLRVRKDGDKFFITHKVDNFDEDGNWTYSDEEETSFEDIDSLKKILSNLGFEKLVKIDNTRSVFNTEDYEIVLEEVGDLGLFLEVEKTNLKENDNPLKIKEEIKDFIHSLGLDFEEQVNEGKPSLMLNKLKGIK